MRKIYSSILLVACLFIAKSSCAAIDVYMRVYDANNAIIPGESTSQYFQNWILLPSMSESSTATIVTGTGGSGVGRPVINPLKFQMPVNAASLPILSMLFRGTRARSVDIWFVKAGVQTCACAFYKIHMENVYITSYESASGDDGPNQQLSLNPEQIAWAYYKQASTGSYPAQPTNTFGWNTATNTPFTFSF